MHLNHAEAIGLASHNPLETSDFWDEILGTKGPFCNQKTTEIRESGLLGIIGDPIFRTPFPAEEKASLRSFFLYHNIPYPSLERFRTLLYRLPSDFSFIREIHREHSDGSQFYFADIQTGLPLSIYYVTYPNASSKLTIGALETIPHGEELVLAEHYYSQNIPYDTSGRRGIHYHGGIYVYNPSGDDRADRYCGMAQSWRSEM